MNRAIIIAMKRKVANILREKTTNKELDEEMANKVKKDLFEILESAGTDTIIPILLATIVDTEVSKYEE